MRSLFATLLALALGCFANASALARDALSCGASGSRVINILSSGISRPVTVFVPAQHKSHMPLVIDLHGSNSNGTEQAAQLRQVTPSSEITASELIWQFFKQHHLSK